MPLRVCLETQRLSLREFTEHDAERLYELDTDPDVMRFIGPFLPRDVDESRAEIRSWIEKWYSNDRGHGVWAVVEKSSTTFRGWIFLRPASESIFAPQAGWGLDELELGYRWHKAAWGRGFATEASRAVVRSAFTELDATRVVAMAMLDNVGSWRVMEKVGLKRVREVTLPGYDSPDVTYLLTRAEHFAAPV